MTLKVALQMDEFSKVNFSSDTSIRIAWGAIRKNLTVYFYMPSDLSFRNGELIAKAYKLDLKPDDESYYKLYDETYINLKEFNYLFIRQDPPFDNNYLTNTYLLEKITNECKIVNHPSGIRNAQEKIAATNFLNLTPPTLISSDQGQITDFIEQFKEVIIKPLYGYAGKDIALIKEYCSKVDDLIHKYNQAIIVQKYIPEIKEGDKRIIMINGEPAGAFLRKPSSKSVAANLAQGGKAINCDLTDRDLEICSSIKNYLIENGLFLVGIDIIGNYLTEINVTSPTGFAQINKLYDRKIEDDLWNELLKN